MATWNSLPLTGERSREFYTKTTAIEREGSDCRSQDGSLSPAKSINRERERVMTINVQKTSKECKRPLCFLVVVVLREGQRYCKFVTRCSDMEEKDRKKEKKEEAREMKKGKMKEEKEKKNRRKQEEKERLKKEKKELPRREKERKKSEKEEERRR
ncbi:uncharacterized protein LOC114842166 [Betta splendens]|uniref:Uncharacterized protein LOC114842166 n=1 Tax=Betta splendens TaxID=158456 RepID=A0A9W2XAK0_BETSP|nr:uncharacterized protein LOC114842166 [Betta splendens]